MLLLLTGWIACKLVVHPPIPTGGAECSQMAETKLCQLRHPLQDSMCTTLAIIQKCSYARLHEVTDRLVDVNCGLHCECGQDECKLP
mmetsp:Transcript_81672/g.228345  ORF Transcript_81672/g.228345 Transcript_81672/m.228345 type:complete len:87 (+) Transcript_81672:96-356(+)